MESDDGFRSFGKAIESDPIGVLLAKWRRDAFIAKLKQFPDVAEAIPSGSLARGTQIGPVHGVDLMVVFEPSSHPNYGSGRESAHAAMEHLQVELLEQLHPWRGAGQALLDVAELRTHVVRCLGGWTGPFAEIIPSAPPVDVMPSVRKGSHLLIPERWTGWIDIDPEKLMRQIMQRQREWEYFIEVIGMVKAWARHNHLGMRSLAVEVMVLKYCPRPGFFETLSCGEAVARFFEAAAKANIRSLEDPAGRCGEIDPGMNYGKLHAALDRAAGLSRQAMDAQYAWENRLRIAGRATNPDDFWRELYGRRYPRARIGFWRAPDTEPSLGKYTVEYPVTVGVGALGPEGLGGGPNGPDHRGRHGLGGRGPEGPDLSPDEPNPRPPGRGSGSQRPSGGASSWPDDPPLDGSARHRPSSAGPSDPPEPAPSEPDADLWEKVFKLAETAPTAPSVFGEGGPPDGRSRSGGFVPPDPASRRYLKGQCPKSIPVGKAFSLLVSIVLEAGPGTAELEPFDVPAEGQDVLLVAHAPGLRLLSDQRLTVHVPAEANSKPVMFELRSDESGVRRVSITAWIGGSYLGELLVEITAEHGRPPGRHRDMHAEIATKPIKGAVSLVVRHDPIQNAYRFEFLDEDYPGEVASDLVYEPGPRVESLIEELDHLAEGRIGYSADQVKFHLQQAGVKLWSELVPAPLREQFWERQHRIRQLTILTDQDVVPWELLYPMDPGHDAGFLVEQFPVMRAIFRWRPSQMLNLWPTRFVLPDEPLPHAKDEIDALRRLLDPGQPPSEVVPAFTQLQDLIDKGEFGLLHFACHNRYDQGDGCSIRLGNVRYTPTLMTTAAVNKVLARSSPTIFMNACRSAGFHATYNRLDGWANKFLEAGAAAFIGTLWAVSDEAAREFAEEFYGQLQKGFSLGEAVMLARRRIAHSRPDDPTWLAYTAYGDPSATVTPAPKVRARRIP
jgi:hypothetical protein